MTTTVYTTAPEWSASVKYTASGETEVYASCTGSNPVTWVITGSDTLPSTAVARGHRLAPGEGIAIILADTERLWFAGTNTYASVEV